MDPFVPVKPHLLTPDGFGEELASILKGQNTQVPGQPSYNPKWYAFTDIWLDPVNGKDTNIGGSMGNTPVPAVKTMAEVIRRYGSAEPKMPYGQSLTVHQLTTQTRAVDHFEFDPIMSGSGNYRWICSPSLVGGHFSPASVTSVLRYA